MRCSFDIHFQITGMTEDIMPKISDTSKNVVLGSGGISQQQSNIKPSNSNELQDPNIRTVIAVNVTSSPVTYTDPDYGGLSPSDRPPSISNSSGGGGFQPKTLVNRTVSNRSSVLHNYVKPPPTYNKKLGHRRVGDDGEVTYKKFETTQLIGSIQLGLLYVMENEANMPERDLLIPVKIFFSIVFANEIFGRKGTYKCTIFDFKIINSTFENIFMTSSPIFDAIFFPSNQRKSATAGICILIF